MKTTKKFKDRSTLWQALIDITRPESQEEEWDPFSDWEDDLAERLQKYFGCEEDTGSEETPGVWWVGRTGVWPDCFQIGIAKTSLTRELVELLRAFIQISLPYASVYVFLLDPDTKTGEEIGEFAVFSDEIWAEEQVADFVNQVTT